MGEGRGLNVAVADETDIPVIAARARRGVRKASSQRGAIVLDEATIDRVLPPPRVRRTYAPDPARAAAYAHRMQTGVLRPARFFLGHYHRIFALGALEALVVAAAFYAALAVRFQAWNVDALELAVGRLWPRAALAILVIAVSLAAMGLYQLRQRIGFTDVAARVFTALAIAEGLFACLFYAVPALFVGRGVMLFMAPVAALGLLGVRYAFARAVDDDVFKRRVLVWGAGREAAAIATRLRRRADQRGFRVMGYVRCCDEEVHVGQSIHITERSQLHSCIGAYRIEEIVVAMDDRRNGFPTEFLRECRMRGVRVRDIVDFLEHESGHVNVELARPSWLIFSEGFRCDMLRASGKRILDVAAALSVLVLSLPITLAAAAIIWLEDRGPVFYRQVRTGQNGRPFRIVKFRSMGVDAESRGAVWATRDDPRTTRFGAFMRKTRIDEIPQVINVLLGDMSFVGPRPERPEFVGSLAKKIPFYNERHFVKPGITGWAQVRFPYGSSEADAREKLGYDLYYVKHHSLVFDLMVMLRTVEVVLFRVGSR
ncbi:MAG TPA: TIGR03013 family XrtA/PEP-CTERM system glycosyltransferase [Usitatibacter sp.]|jgi:sugar transferase (PEP-CTERM system associated)|nr:TIGR03013 family XrtA/PEP-CTERM system glycosyltransferase [Usitatibacter sp.]